MNGSLQPQDAVKVAESISTQLNGLISDITRVLREVLFTHLIHLAPLFLQFTSTQDCSITKSHMEVCSKSVEDLITEMNTDTTKMDDLVVKIEQLINELASVETLANKLFVIYCFYVCIIDSLLPFNHHLLVFLLFLLLLLLLLPSNSREIKDTLGLLESLATQIL